MELREHQKVNSEKIKDILSKKGICYLYGEVRSGKTLTALNAVDSFKKVLFITKKKAISSIIDDYNNFGFRYELEVINYESLHKINIKPDVVIYDEAHSLGAYPKPSNRSKLAKKKYYNVPCILMSGTPSVESYSQLYHQFYVSKFSPFKQYTNFYKWAKDFVNVTEKHLATHVIKDYSGAKVQDINNIITPYIVKMTQSDAGLTTTIKEHILTIPTPTKLKAMADKLINDRVIEGKTGYILGDAPAKLLSKTHQLINGHCIIEQANGDTFIKVFDTYKVNYIKERFKWQKIAIMYYYKAELEMLQNILDITTDLEEFNTTDKSIALQQNSTEGMNVSKADCIVFMNLGFSGKNYLQSRDRLTIKGRETNDVYYICEDYGLTLKILKTVQDKKDFNTKAFQKWQANSRQD